MKKSVLCKLTALFLFAAVLSFSPVLTAQASSSNITAASGETTESSTTVDISNADVTLSKTTCTYSGRALEPSVTLTIVRSGELVTLVQGTDYSVSYSSNTNVGTAKVTITGMGNCTGTLEVTFQIIPKSTKFTSVTGASKAFSAEWKKVTKQVSGYQIQYATNKTFSKGKGTVTIEGKKTTSQVVRSVKAKKTYYLRIRTYKTVNGKKYYSEWSSYKKVKTSTRITMFGGDSLMTGVAAYGDSAMDISGTIKYAAYTSLNTKTYRTTKTGNGQTCAQKVIAAQPHRFYIMLGMNEVTWKSTEDIYDDWVSLIKYLKKKCPTTDIVVLSMTPVTRSKASSVTGFKKINKYNQTVQKAAKACGVTYYDFTSSFKDSSGYLKSKYNGGDGIHLSYAGYQHVAEVLSEYDATLD